MVQSLNSQADYVTKANLFVSLIGSKHGQILIGNKAFEFYNERNPENYLQIPWQEIRQVRAIMLSRNRFIRGFFVDTKQAGSYHFVVENAGHTLKVMRQYLTNEQIVRNQPIFSWRNFITLFKKST